MAEIDGKAHGESWGPLGVESHHAQSGEFIFQIFHGQKWVNKKPSKKSQDDAKLHFLVVFQCDRLGFFIAKCHGILESLISLWRQ